VLNIQKVVCPVDFSPISKRALDHAAVIARWYEAELVVLHVAPLMPTLFGFPAALDTAAVAAADADAVIPELTGFVAEAATMVSATQTIVRSGSPAVEILHYAAEAEADFLVLGTHGRTGFERFMVGSVTEKVLRKAPCPVLSVPPRCEGQPERPVFGRILCGADFSEASDHAAEYALSLAQEANGRLTLLHVVDWMPDKNFAKYPQFDPAAYRQVITREARRQLEGLIPEEARNWCEPDLRISCGKPYREILRVAAEDQADLIVLGVHGLGPIDRMLFGSTTEHVVRQAPCPVLTIRS
jgi:nucleotide-binding universal stress UspA family protein